MTPNGVIADALVGSLGMLKMLLSDFSDAEMLARSCPGANHALWQLGHLIRGDTFMLNVVKEGAAPPIPQGWAEKFDNKTATIDDPAAFPAKAELLAHLEKLRGAAVDAVKSLSPEDLERPLPENLRWAGPNIAALALFPALHMNQHAGQIQVLRRRLGKKVLF